MCRCRWILPRGIQSSVSSETASAAYPRRYLKEGLRPETFKSEIWNWKSGIESHPQKLRVPRWCWTHSSRPVARVRPLLTWPHYIPLREIVSDPCLGSGLTANRINLFNASGLYLAFDWCSCSPRPALSYRPLLTLSSFTLRCEERLCLSPGRCTNRVNFRTCQRTIMVLTSLFL